MKFVAQIASCHAVYLRGRIQSIASSVSLPYNKAAGSADVDGIRYRECPEENAVVIRQRSGLVRRQRHAYTPVLGSLAVDISAPHLLKEFRLR